MKMTIKDIARLCDVSVTTVSRVLNNKTDSIGRETVARIREKIEEVGYRPNSVARSMITGQSHTIGLVVPDNSNPFFAELARSIEDIGYAEGYSVILCNSDYSVKKELAYVDALIARQIDGIIYISTGQSGDTSRKMQGNGVAFVEVGHNIVGSRFGVVSIDYAKGGFLATSHLIGLGHKRIGCIAGGIVYTHSEQRLDGYKNALETAGMESDPRLIVSGDFRLEGGERAMQELLALKEPPSAVFAFNDMMALGAIRAVKASGFRVPEDISIVGYDNIGFGRVIDPPLTTIDHPVAAVADAVMNLLFRNIMKESGLPENRSEFQGIEPRLIIRESATRRNPDIEQEA